MPAPKCEEYFLESSGKWANFRKTKWQTNKRANERTKQKPRTSNLLGIGLLHVLLCCAVPWVHRSSPLVATSTHQPYLDLIWFDCWKYTLRCRTNHMKLLKQTTHNICWDWGTGEGGRYGDRANEQSVIKTWNKIVQNEGAERGRILIPIL